MLPSHVLADVTGWLHFYDLDALMLTDARCADLARLAASKIRVFDFSEYDFNVHSAEIDIFKLAADGSADTETELRFLDATDLLDFIPAALQNCVLDSLLLRNKDVCDAISEVTHTVIVKGRLFLFEEAFATAHDLVQFAVSFRSVKVRS